MGEDDMPTDWRRRTARTRTAIFVVALLSLSGLLLSSKAQAQQVRLCPDETASLPVSADGKIVFHQSLRPWVGFVPQMPLCISARTGRPVEIEVAGEHDDNYQEMRSLDGCTVRASGDLGFLPSPYWATGYKLSHLTVTPLQACNKEPSLPEQIPDPGTANVRRYTASATVHQSPVPAIDAKAWTTNPNGTKAELPKAYAQYSLNGGMDLLNLKCRDGYKVVCAASATRSSLESDDIFHRVAVTDTGDSNITIGCVKENLSVPPHADSLCASARARQTTTANVHPSKADFEFEGFLNGQRRNEAEANAKNLGFGTFNCERAGNKETCVASMSRSQGQRRDGAISLTFVNGQLGWMMYGFVHREYAAIVAEIRSNYGDPQERNTAHGFSLLLWEREKSGLLLMEAGPPDWKGDTGTVVLQNKVLCPRTDSCTH